MRSASAKRIALGGVLTALAVILMCLGSLIPVATYISPLLCMLAGSLVYSLCGKRIAWAWYGAVAILSLLLAPDKEAAAVYAFLGSYPILKPWFDKKHHRLFLKFFYFNALITLMYSILLYVLGIEQLLSEFQEVGLFGMLLLLVLGNITFYLLDVLLSRVTRLIRRRKYE